MRRLARKDILIFAGLRKKEHAESLMEGLSQEEKSRIHPIIMDVTKEDQIQAAVLEVQQKLAVTHRKLYAIINNAGIMLANPLELVETGSIC